MDKQKPDSYNGRFGEKSGNGYSHSGAYRSSATQAGSTRRPSGFGTAGQTAKVKPAAQEDTKKAGKPEKIKKEKPKKEKRIRKERDPGKKRPLLRILLSVIGIAVLVCVLMVLIFGGKDTTYHQMPTIERESIAHFEPEETPIPGMEGL